MEHQTYNTISITNYLEDQFMDKSEFIKAIIIAIIGSSTLNGIVTHLLYNNKLKKELKYKGNNAIAKEIGSSLQCFRDIELQLKVQEIYNISNQLDEKSRINFWGGECIYQEIFNTRESLVKYMNNIRNCRINHEKNFSCKTALNLVYIDRYFLELIQFIKKFGDDVDYPLWGTVFIADLNKWQAKIDKLLVKEINRYTYKLESHETIKWKLLRKKEVEKQFQKTILYSLVTGKIKGKKNNKLSKLIETINKFS